MAGRWRVSGSICSGASSRSVANYDRLIHSVGELCRQRRARWRWRRTVRFTLKGIGNLIASQVDRDRLRIAGALEAKRRLMSC